MRYKCIPCGDEFDFEDNGKPRCPKCLGIHDIEKVESSRAPEPERRKPLTAVVVIALAVAVAIAYFTFGKKGDGTQASDAELSKTAQTTLEKLNLPGGKSALPFAITDEIRGFAKNATQGKKGDPALLGVFNAIAKKKTDGFFKPYPQRDPRAGGVFTAKEVLTKLETKQEPPFEALSYELAALMLAMARSIDEDAEMVEIDSYKGTQKPADPGGKHGRYGVSLTDKDSKVYDPWGGIVVDAGDVHTHLMTETAAMAPFFGLKSLSLLIRQESSEAMKLNEAAIELDPKNPHLRAARGFIFASTGVPTEAIAEFEKAVKLRDNAVFRTNLGEMLLMTDPTGKLAEKHIQLAIQKMPNYARAHGLLAMSLLVQRQMDSAEQELRLADSLDPGSPAVAMLFSQFHLAKGDSLAAIEKAEEAARLSGENQTSMLGLAQVYRATARFDEMRKTLDQVLAKTDSNRVAEQIKELFGYEPDAADGDAPAAASTGFELKLGQGNSSLGGKGPKLGGGLGKGLELKPGLQGQKLDLQLDLNKKEE